MEKLYHWAARRSGGRITIEARDETGERVKHPNVDTITVKDGKIIATDKDGDTFDLGTLQPATVPA